MDEMNDPRLTKEYLSYEVWHYILGMEWLVQAQMTGLALGDSLKGYEAGTTPRAYAIQRHAQAALQIVDNLSPFAQWISNYIDDLSKLNKTIENKPAWQPRVGRDEKGWLMQVWWNHILLGVFRFDKTAPAPPGWRH